MLSQEESKDSEPREDLTSPVNSVDSFPEGEAEGFGEKATEGEAENKAGIDLSRRLAAGAKD